MGNNKSSLKILVFAGEHEKDFHEKASQNAELIADYINSGRHEADIQYVNSREDWHLAPDFTKSKAQLAFLASHGTHCKPGVLQDIFSAAKIPYTGADARTHALVMNNFLFLKSLKIGGFLSPDVLLVSRTRLNDSIQSALQHIKYYLGYPVIVSENISRSEHPHEYFVENATACEEACHMIADTCGDALIKKSRYGRAYSVPVVDLNNSGSSYALEPVEYSPNPVPYLYTPSELNRSLQRLSRDVHGYVNGNGYSELKVVLTKNHEPIVTGLNLIPGFHDNGILAESMRRTKIKTLSVVEGIINAGLCKTQLS